MFETIYFRFRSSPSPRAFLPLSHLFHIYSLGLKEEKKIEIRRATKLEWRKENAKNLRLYSFLSTASFLLSLKLHSLFVSVLLSVNRNFSPSAIPRTSSLGHSRFSSLAQKYTRPSERSSVFSIPSQSPTPTPLSSFRSFSSLPWRPRG